jgi:hypothetical protein
MVTDPGALSKWVSPRISCTWWPTPVRSRSLSGWPPFQRSHRASSRTASATSACAQAPPHRAAGPVCSFSASASAGARCTCVAAACYGSDVGASSGRFAANYRSQAAPASAGSVGGQEQPSVSVWRRAPAATLRYCRSVAAARRCPRSGAPPSSAVSCRCVPASRRGAASGARREASTCGGSGSSARCERQRSAPAGSRISTYASRCRSVSSPLCRANQSLQWTQGRPSFQAPRGLQLTRRSPAFGAALRH